MTLARRWSGVEGVEGTDHGTHEGWPALLCRRACTDQHTVVACASWREQFNSSASILANFGSKDFELRTSPWEHPYRRWAELQRGIQAQQGATQ